MNLIHHYMLESVYKSLYMYTYMYIIQNEHNACIINIDLQAASPADSALSALLQDLANGPEGVGLTLLEL